MNKLCVAIVTLFTLIYGCAVPESIDQEKPDYSREVIGVPAAHHPLEPDFEMLKRSYVRIITEHYVEVCAKSEGGSEFCFGGPPIISSVASGFAVKTTFDNDTIILTANHVCHGLEGQDFSQEEAQLIKQFERKNLTASFRYYTVRKLYDIDGQSYTQNKIDQRHAESDICTIRSADLKAPTVKLAEKEPRYGEEIFLVGAPIQTWYVGMVPIAEGRYGGALGARPEGYEMEYWGSASPLQEKMVMLNLSSNQGASGSPVFNSRGEVVSLLSMVYNLDADIAYGPSLSEIRELVSTN